MSTIDSPGFYPDLTPAQYFAEPCPEVALTATGIGMLIKSAPAKFAHAFIGEPVDDTNEADEDEAPGVRVEFGVNKSTAAQYLGSLVHRLALGKGADYVELPFKSWAAKGAKDARAEAEAGGAIAVKEPDMRRAEAMAAVLRDRIAEACQGRPYQTEVVLAWKRNGRWCRAMLDAWCPALMLGIDVKTCADASDDAVIRALAGGYARQDAHYRDGIETVTGESGRAQFRFLFVENKAPFLSRPAWCSEGFRDGAADECARAFRIFDHCMTTGEWPGFQPLQGAMPPVWLARQWAEAELEEAA